MISENTVTESDSSERLYLFKSDKGDIYVNIRNLHQHQVKGIRFLYMNMLKETPRVILNDPSGYGKTLQLVLFLSAVQHKLSKPILILCNDGEVGHWKEHFKKWTNIDDSTMAIELTNPFANKSIHINTVENLQQFSRRDWGILVVDVGDTAKNVLRMNYKADYIIWVTNTDMKKNLHTFSSIYKWFYPKETFHIEEFTPKRDDINDIIKKAIRLDAFFENIVLRRDDFSTPCIKTAPQAATLSPLKPSRKGKDITGTKIKRTKRKTDNTTINETNPNNIIVDFKKTLEVSTSEKNENSNDFNIKNSVNVCNDINKEKVSEMDIEDFIHSQKPIGADGFEDFNNSDNNSQNSQEDNTEAKDRSLEKTNESNHDVSALAETNSPKVDLHNNEAKKGKLEKVSSDDNGKSLNKKIDSEVEANLVNDTATIIGIGKSNGEGNIKDTSSTDSEVTKIEIVEETIIEEVEQVNTSSNKDETKKRSDMDSILEDLEAKTFKKFKGSLLDSLF